MRKAMLRYAFVALGTGVLLNGCGKESTSSAQNAPQPDQIAPAEAPSNVGVNSQQPAAAALSSADNSAATMAGPNSGPSSESSGLHGGSSASPSGVPTTGSDASPSNSGTGTSANLTDAQIAGVNQAANASEVEQAKVAKGRAKRTAVKQFADMMIAQHQAAEQQQAKLGIKSADSPVETQLDQDASDTLNRLKSVSSADFDREYIDAQVREHKQLLSLIDNQLLPSTKSTALKNYIEQIRSSVALHLKHAEDQQRALDATTSRDSNGRGANSPASPNTHSGESSSSSSGSKGASATR